MNRARNIHTYIIIFVLFYLLTISVNEEDNISLNNVTELEGSTFTIKRNMSISQYIVHDPIEINGNGNLFLQAINEGWPGDGTSTNPITIDGYNITALSNISCIRISHTTHHVKISNCYLCDGE